MSEENNLDAATISTTEDAFDQFQANSMYEEEEFITLSDIVSPGPTTIEEPQLPSDISDSVPYDNEIVLPSNCDTQISNSEPGVSDTTIVTAFQINAGNELLVEQISVPNDQDINRRPKRGRKKKILENFVTDSPESVETIEKSSIDHQQVSTDIKTSGKSRRGRKPKQKVVAQNDNNESNSETLMKQEPNTVRKRGRKRRSENIVPKELTQSPVNTTSRRRGRPRKSSFTPNSQDSSELQSCSNYNNSGELVKYTSIVNSDSIQKSAKQGRKKKQQDESTNEQPPNKQQKVTDEIAINLKALGEGSADAYDVGELQQSGTENQSQLFSNHDMDEDDDGDNMSLSKLKKCLDIPDNPTNFKDEIDVTSSVEELAQESIHNSMQESTQEPIQESAEQSIPECVQQPVQEVKESVQEPITVTNPTCTEIILEDTSSLQNGDVNTTSNVPEESLLVEDISKRPVRRKAKKILHYEEDSDEDPFANVELSDDEPRGKRGRRYDEDAEYKPGSEHKKGPHKIISSSSDSDISIKEDIDLELSQKKRIRNKSVRKRNSSFVTKQKDLKNDESSINDTAADTIDLDQDDVEVCLEPSVIRANEKQPTEFTDEFENFIAQKIQGTSLKIKKVSSKQSLQSVPLEIPVLVPEAKKSVEISSQTDSIKTASIGLQTSTPYEVSVKDNVALTSEQSEQACEFLKSIVKTTSELGQLMTEKSEDFITKKINKTNVTDTAKMDYCVKKSFLLLKLAKHNILQMEQDLTEQYDEFLKRTNLMIHIKKPTVITPAEKDNDSDCEIVEEPVQQNSQKAKFNPKTVFLNKELSIKIAKKPAVKVLPKIKNKLNIKDKLNIKNTHTVWINDTVMVKKVKPTQSFLAQDSRNKKPPDCYVSEKMVNDFFKNYNKTLAQSICSPFTSPDWRVYSETYVCCYFTAETSPSTGILVNEDIFEDNNTENSTSVISTGDPSKLITKETTLKNPASLFTLCTTFWQNYLKMSTPKNEEKTHDIMEERNTESQAPRSLFRLCLKTLTEVFKYNSGNCLSSRNPYQGQKLPQVKSLKEICYKKVTCLFSLNVTPKTFTPRQETNDCFKTLHCNEILENNCVTNGFHTLTFNNVLPLKSLCYRKVINFLQRNENIEICSKSISSNGVSECDSDIDDSTITRDLKITNTNIFPLKTLCYRKMLTMFSVNSTIETNTSENLLDENSLCETSSDICSMSCTNLENDDFLAELDLYIQGQLNPKSLFSLCLESIQKQQKKSLSDDTKMQENIALSFTFNSIVFTPNSLKEITLKYIKTILFYESEFNQRRIITTTVRSEDQTVSKVKKLAVICLEMVAAYITSSPEHLENSEKSVGLTINSVNTLSEEAFLSMYEDNSDVNAGEEGDNFYDEDNYDGDFNNSEEETNGDDNNWVAQLQMKELRSCPETVTTNTDTEVAKVHEDEPVATQIKLEPLDDLVDNLIESAIVKTEPVVDPISEQHFDEMTVIPDSVITKQERIESANDGRVEITRHNSSSYDVDSFENFVKHNKMMHPIDEPDDDMLYSQSGQRIRRQHEPDYNNEYDPALSLLIPQTFEPISIETVKGSLMESSSDEDNISKKASGKKKIDKRPKQKKVKKNDTKQQNKEVPAAKEKTSQSAAATPPTVINEVAMLTRRMKERIRQEKKKIESSDSGEENVPLSTRKEKTKERKEKDNGKKTKENDKTKPSHSKSKVDDEIQCNNVDSTEQIDSPNDSTERAQNFTGFTAVDQNEMTSYEKYVKYVYNKILPKVSEEAEVKTPEIPESTQCAPETVDRPETPLIDYEDPVEMLECEPTMPIFEENEQELSKPLRKSQKKNKNRPDIKQKEIEKKLDDTTQEIIKVKTELGIQPYFDVTKTNEDHLPIPTKAVQESSHEASKTNDEKKRYIERNGWKCYLIDSEETKLYQNTSIILDKLPESFVETYFMYQNITEKNEEDEEVDRLINLNSLNRYPNKEGRKPKPKSKINAEGQIDRTVDIPRPDTPNSDAYAELTASEDEVANVDDEPPPPAPRQTNENTMAKSSLMNDSDSDEALAKVKNEPIDGQEPTTHERTRAKSKKKSKVVEELISDQPESLMLTADKMMNKELNLLHAPVVLDDEKKLVEKGTKGPPKSKHKRESKRHSSKDHINNEDDSSSEEEKQWVSTKEKLLKRLVKKQDSTGADDAKRAKIVSEFIQRRGGGSEIESRRKRSIVRRGRLSARKKLEREKQMRVLSHELMGIDDAMTGPRGAHVSQSYFKGRRNIRKVIDKKSLQRSTVIANMEEFERKRRLIQRQARLREELGVEDGVNVVVINDEVCLEYSFEEQRPLVSVHPFFTKVMKAHQYEGVKFMWDACFESLEKVESGHPGGGCILAHCMGLGKTLQVLALLHTVLTHPRVGMQRVLVCCPLSTVLNWVDEIHKWIGPVTDQIKVFELSKLKKTYERAYQLEDWYNGGGIFIIGYELFRSLTTICPELDDVRPTIVNKIRTALLDPGPDIIICDEGHLLKNDCSVLAIAMSRVATKRRIVLTGTPMQNNLREYYCMVNFVKPNLLGTYSEYSNRFENPIMNGQHRDSQEEDIKLMKQRTHILHKVLEGCLQRQEASVLYPYLPKKHEYTVFISLTAVQWDLYKHYIDNYSGNHKKTGILKDFHTLQKIWSHPQVLHNFQMKARDDSDKAKIKPEKLEDDLAHEDLAATEDIKPIDTETWWLDYLDNGNMLESLDSSNKFVVVFRILDECIALGDKVLIFSTSLITLDALEYFLKKINKWSLGQEYYRLDGSVPAEVRQKWCREFNAEHNLKTKLFLISTRAGCLGLNMVAANRVIIFDTSWNPAHDIQSIFRVYRFGQKKDCYIYRLVALGTMEQKIYERSVTKQAVACRVVDEQQIDRHYNLAELTELYKYDEIGASVAGGVAVGVCDVALLRVARLPALHAVHEHDSLLRGSTEQGLNQTERDAVWRQFQQEHAHKQMQNQLTSSFALHLTMPNLETNSATHLEMPGPSSILPTQQESEVQNKTEPQPIPPPIPPLKIKKGKGRPKKSKSHPEPTPPPQPQTTEKEDIEEELINKVMNLLIKHNFTTQSHTEIAKLVAKVRTMVLTGKVPKGLNNDLAKSIADVLMTVKAPVEESQPVEQESKMKPEVKPSKKRGRKRKSETPPEPILEPAPEILLPENTGRRRAALLAERQMEVNNDGVIDLDGDDDWHNDDLQNDDWQNYTAPEAVPETPQKETPVRTEQEISTRPITQTNDSILLSDDDEPTPKPTTRTKRRTFRPAARANKTAAKADNTAAKADNTAAKADNTAAKADNTAAKADNTAAKADNTAAKADNAVAQTDKTVAETNQTLAETGRAVVKKEPKKPETNVPLHISLLSNKNFIKIIAHTYLEGNPMLDEDAATLAAQYSALKAKKEIETTGIEITSGPIYDIALKVLGRDVLEKLQKANPSPAPQKEQPLAAEQTVTDVKTEIQLKPGPRLKAKAIAQLTAPKDPIPSVEAKGPSVVPVGLFNSAGNITSDESFTPEVREESILPDDDDIIINDRPAPNKSIFKKKAKPLILNSVLATGGIAAAAAAVSTSAPRPPIPKLVISAGKLMPQPNLTQALSTARQPPTVNLIPQRPTANPIPQPSEEATICLDSDEEEITPHIEPPKPTKRVATKSTAKPPVPVSLTAANQHLSHYNPAQNVQVSNQYQLKGKNYFVIPSSQINKLTPLPPGVTPAMYTQSEMTQNMPNMTQNMPNMIQNMPNMTQNMPNMIQSMPNMTQNMQSMFQNTGNMYQNMQNMYQNSNLIPQNVRMPQNVMQNVPYSTPNINQSNPYGVALNQQAQLPQNLNKPSESILSTQPISTAAAKTVCKPGDILRVTKTGQIEILNRATPDTPAPSEVTAPRRSHRNTAANIAVPPKFVNIAPAETPKPPAEPPEVSRPPATPESSRVRNISFSSSEDSRPTSPEASDDPLSILKDVVHIQAVDYPIESNKKKSKDSILLGSTSTSRSSKTSTPSKTTTQKRDDILKNISKTDSILKKLDHFLSPSLLKPTTSKSSVTAPKPSTSQKSSSTSQKPSSTSLKPYPTRKTPTATKAIVNSYMDIIDLDDDVPTVTAPEVKTNAKPASTIKPSSKVAVPVKKVEGTSKNIILNFTGNSATMTTLNNGNKPVANVAKVAQAKPKAALATTSKAADVKKRPAPAPASNVPKKKKTELMTLKDFNIDDIDDIIELE